MDGADSPIAGYQPQGLGNRLYGNPEPSNKPTEEGGGVLDGQGCVREGGKGTEKDSPHLHMHTEAQVEAGGKRRG